MRIIIHFCHQYGITPGNQKRTRPVNNVIVFFLFSFECLLCKNCMANIYLCDRMAQRQPQTEYRIRMQITACQHAVSVVLAALCLFFYCFVCRIFSSFLYEPIALSMFSVLSRIIFSKRFNMLMSSSLFRVCTSPFRSFFFVL